MKLRVKKIRIKSREDFNRELLSLAKSLDKGNVPKRAQRGEYFESLDAVRKVLTEKRLELWRVIRDQQPESISALAVYVKRGFKSVYRDLLLLQSLGLIDFKKTKGKRGDLQAPFSLADELQLAVA